MKLLAIAILLAAGTRTSAPVSFDAESVRVGELAITDLVLQMKETASGVILVSKGSVEPLSSPLSVSLAEERTLILEPGVRVSRLAAGFGLTVHNRRRVEIEVAGEKTIVVMPVTIEVTEAGWKVAGKEYAAKELTARRLQDDVDKDLNSLGDTAKRILNTTTKGPRTTTPGTTAQDDPSNRRGRGSKFRGGGGGIPNFYLTSDAFSSYTIQGLAHASPSGF